MKELVCWNNSSGTSSPFVVTNCLRNYFTGGLTSLDSVFDKIIQVEQSPLIRQQVAWRNNTERMTEKKVLKLQKVPLKNKHLPSLEIDVALTKRRKIVPIKQVWIG